MKREQAPSVFCWSVDPAYCDFGERGKRVGNSRSEGTRSPSSNSQRVVLYALWSKQSNYHMLWPICIRRHLNPKWQWGQRPVRFVTCWWGKVWPPEVMLKREMWYLSKTGEVIFPALYQEYGCRGGGDEIIVSCNSRQIIKYKILRDGRKKRDGGCNGNLENGNFGGP